MIAATALDEGDFREFQLRGGEAEARRKAAESYFSQWGEDVLLQEIFARLGISIGYFVEFGAWDGEHLSNTRVLYLGGWHGCYIEGDRPRFEALAAKTDTTRVTCLNAFVRGEGPGSLDNLLKEAGAPEDFDLLSIDIDSDDYRVWAALKDFHPKVVVVEFNQTIPNSYSYVQPPGKAIGNSAAALVELAEARAYALVAATTGNLIFVKRELLKKSLLEKISLERARKDLGAIFYGMDGSLVVDGEMARSPWSDKSVAELATVHTATSEWSLVDRPVRFFKRVKSRLKSLAR